MTSNLSVIGQIATEPKLFTPAGGAEFCTFRLASTERRYDAVQQTWVDTDTNWFTVNAFRSLARHAKHSFRTGDRVVVAGKLRVRPWVADDRRGTSVEIDADGLGHDVRFGVSAFVKSGGGEASSGFQVADSSDDTGLADASAEPGRGLAQPQQASAAALPSGLPQPDPAPARTTA